HKPIKFFVARAKLGKLRNGASSITCLNVKKEFQDIFEAQIMTMLEKAEKAPGHICSMVIPPLARGGNYQVIQKFSAQQHLQTWQASKENTHWQEKLEHWSESDNISCHSTNTTG